MKHLSFTEGRSAGAAAPAPANGVTQSSYRRNMSPRETEPVRAGLERWIRTQWPDAGRAVVTAVTAPTGNGASSDTVLFDVAGLGSSGDAQRSLVARMAPTADSVTVYAGYDFRREAKIMQMVGAAGVPVPRVLGVDTTGEYTGAPFLAMERVEGDVPPDYPPYAVDSWLSRGSEAEIERLEASTVTALAGLVKVEVPEPSRPLLTDQYRPRPPGIEADLERWVSYHYSWAAKDVRVPLLDRAYATLRDNLPRHPGPHVVSWGDARLGNIIYRDFRPVALLDWEMPGFTPPEVDLGYLIFMHRFLEDRIRQAGGTGMPSFMDADRVEARYEAASGYTPRDRAFYQLYASVRFASMAVLVSLRKVATGLMPAPRTPDDLVPHRQLLTTTLDAFPSEQRRN